MIGADIRGPSRSEIENARRATESLMERAALRTVAAAARTVKSRIRTGFSGAGLGRLGNAIDANADTNVVRIAGGDFSASARIFVRSRSERTLGALAAYTDGAQILPVRGRWLWIATDEIPKFAGKQRMTPELYRQTGKEASIGPLVLVRSVNGYPLLVVRNASVSAVGLPRKAKRLNRNGTVPKGRRAKEFIVAFVGIPRTSRAARINITAICDQFRKADMPDVFARELQREAKG